MSIISAEIVKGGVKVRTNGELIAKLRKQRGISSRNKLANAIDVSVHAICAIETSKTRNTRSDILLKLAVLFDVSPFDLVIEKDSDYEFLERR